MAFIMVMAAVSAVYAGLRPDRQRAFVGLTATNLANLRTDPIGTLVASAFVAKTAPWIWVAFAVVGLFPVARRFGNLRGLLLVGGSHVIGSLVSEGLLAWRISAGAMPTSMRHLDDVGPSYVVAAALVVTVLFGAGPAGRAARLGHGLFDRVPSRWWRIGAAVCLVLLARDLLQGLDRLDVAAVGHVVSMTAGAAVGALLADPPSVHTAGAASGSQPAIPSVPAPVPAPAPVPVPGGTGAGARTTGGVPPGRSITGRQVAGETAGEV